MTVPDFTRLTDLAQPRLGSSVVFATDDFFAAKARLINPEDPVFIEGKFDENGKWMDGWESRRKRTPGHDHCIIRLGKPGQIAGFEIDTRHFTGNFPPAASIEACTYADEIPGADIPWTELVANTNLKGDDRLHVAVTSDQTWTHIRLSIYPDGGVARLRIYGHVHMDWSTIDPATAIDLAAMAFGGRGVTCNDEHFGHLSNLIAPGRGINMGDGWETRRRREPGHDWAIVELAHPGIIEAITVDTAYFKGNYPDRCSIQAALEAPGSDDDIAASAADWPVIMTEQKLAADREHHFKSEIIPHELVRYVRLNIFPDGGVSRLRLFGRPVLANASPPRQ